MQDAMHESDDAFFQAPPELGDTFEGDPVLRAYLERVLPREVLEDVRPELAAMGSLAGGPLAREFHARRDEEPELVAWDAWGRRVDRIEITDHWKACARVAAERGVVATAYEKRHGEASRVHQFALAYLFEPSSGVYTCPLAMTDGAAKTLLALGNAGLVRRAVPRLTSRDPGAFWTSGQWMTERTGGSDVGLSETRAVPTAEEGVYALHGTKWFTSATTSEMALTLARPVDETGRSLPGGAGLALFYVELLREDGRRNAIAVNRLKEKLGTRMVPTAELTLHGARAVLVAGPRDGVKNIAPMLGVTRTWNAVAAASGMRRGLALAKDYARRRVAFGAPLARKPLHVDTLAVLEAEAQGAFQLAFRLAELMGSEENGAQGEHEAELHRLLTPIAKLTTGKQAVAVASEVLEAFGGAGYIEDTGLPRLLRDAQVLPIWEGTTNVLSLDVLRVLARGGRIATLAREVLAHTRGAAGGRLEGVAKAAGDAVAHAEAWARSAASRGGTPALEAGARRLALTLGRALELAYLVAQAGDDEAKGRGPGAAAAARVLARSGVDLIADDGEDQAVDDDARVLAGEA